MVLFAAALVIFGGTAHLRSGDTREWRSFSAVSQGKVLTVPFQSQRNPHEYSLLIRQRDVKNRNWAVRINGTPIGVLLEDERRMICILPIPANLLREGRNLLEITSGPGGAVSDDIAVGEAEIRDIPAAALLRQSEVNVTTPDAKPVRFSVVDAKGWLTPLVSLRNEANEALRTGVVYSGDGQARIGLPAGEYRIYASRGFEYSAPSAHIRLRSGAPATVRLAPKREVAIPGYVSVDTHVHTREWSGHGDASVDERVLTAAGEGVDVIVATEHNRLADYGEAITRRGLTRYVRSIPGNEVTTGMGHFNVFPSVSVADARQQNWSALMGSLDTTVVIQNHPRDAHSNYRPFDPRNYLSVIGENLNGRPVRANAMEIVNSGAMASDPLQLVRDWMGLLTRGLQVAGIGASDTHTVDFVPIGQARTYVSAPAVAESIATGNTLVSYGLAVTLRPAGPVRDATVPVELNLYAPSWSGADEITVFSNGIPVWQRRFNRTSSMRRAIRIPIPKHDTALVAVATGPGVLQPFWEVRKPYQPTSKTWTPLVLGVSSAAWIDGDGDDKRTSPMAYAQMALSAGHEFAQYDDAVVAHAAHLLYQQGESAEEIRARFGARRGYRQYLAQKTLASK